VGLVARHPQLLVIAPCRSHALLACAWLRHRPAHLIEALNRVKDNFNSIA
jgi:hypothetical protein